MNLTLRILVVSIPWVTWLVGSVVVIEPYQAGAVVSGQVYDNRFGLPVTGAKVRILLAGQVKGHEISDQRGYYEIKGLLTTQYTVSVESLGFARTERTAEVRSGETFLLDIPLKIGHLHDPVLIEINGIVKLSDNSPASDTIVQLISPFDPEIAARTRTDQLGRYAVRVSDPGQYVLYAFKSGFTVATIPIILHPTLERGPHTVADIILSSLSLK